MKKIIILALFLSACATTTSDKKDFGDLNPSARECSSLYNRINRGVKFNNEEIALFSACLHHNKMELNAEELNLGKKLLMAQMEEVEMDSKISIDLPPSKINLEANPFVNTTEYFLGRQGDIVYYFYYGEGGRYLVKILTEKHSLSKAEVSLLVDREKNPETISLARISDNLFYGIGNSRKGEVKYSLEVFIPASGFFNPVKHNFSYKIDVER